MAFSEISLEKAVTDCAYCAEFLEYWNSKKPDALPPARSSFDPMIEKWRLTPRMFIYETIDDGRDFRLRLIGTQIVELFGSDPTGHYLSDIWVPEEVELMLELFRKCMETGNPVAIKGSYHWKHRSYVDWYCIISPLRLKCEKVEQFLGVLCPLPPYTNQFMMANRGVEVKRA